VENGGGDAAVSFRRIVRLESLVLLAILILAARLGALSPLE
jgi:putative copper export protein